MSNNWNIDSQRISDYENACQLSVNDDNCFNVFKSNPSYNYMLEHISYNDGLVCYNSIKSNNNFLLDKNNIDLFITNDLYGTPNIRKYDYFYASPSTLRYIKVLSDLITHFNNLDNIVITEIGCGYGGQCKIIYDLFKPKQYNLIDLHYPLLLQQKYLYKFDNVKNANFIEADEIIENNRIIEKSDLIISNYCYSELTEGCQEIYFNNVIKNSNNGYITCNAKIEYLRNNINKKYIIEKDIHNFNTNFIFIFLYKEV